MKLADILGGKKKAYLRARIQELETNSTNKNIRDLYRGISDFKTGCQPRCNIIKDEKGDLVADSHSIVASEVEFTVDKLKSHKSPGIDQIPAELIKAGGRTICLEIRKLITSIWKKEELAEEWKESIILPIHKKVDKNRL